MELQEKSAFAREKPIYDAIPLIILDKGEKRHYKVTEYEQRYYVSSPFCMTVRLFLFWTLWAALVITMVISILAHFWYATRRSYNFDVYENANATRSKYIVT